jgi:hypothetical protein
VVVGDAQNETKQKATHEAIRQGWPRIAPRAERLLEVLESAVAAVAVSSDHTCGGRNGDGDVAQRVRNEAAVCAALVLKLTPPGVSVPNCFAHTSASDEAESSSTHRAEINHEVPEMVAFASDASSGTVQTHCGGTDCASCSFGRGCLGNGSGTCSGAGGGQAPTIDGLPKPPKVMVMTNTAGIRDALLTDPIGWASRQDRIEVEFEMERNQNQNQNQNLP